LTDAASKEIQNHIIDLFRDSLKSGRITRDEGFLILEQIVNKLENEIVRASKSS